MSIVPSGKARSRTLAQQQQIRSVLIFTGALSNGIPDEPYQNETKTDDKKMFFNNSGSLAVFLFIFSICQSRYPPSLVIFRYLSLAFIPE